MKKKIIVGLLILAVGVFAWGGVLYNDKTEYVLEIIQSLETTVSDESREVYKQDIKFLLKQGYTRDEIIILDSDIRQVAALLRSTEMTEAEKANLKKGFLTSRPTDPEILTEKSYPLEYEEMGIVPPSSED